MKTDNSLENKSLEELKELKIKSQKIFAIVSGFMTVALGFIVYVAFETKNWGFLGMLALVTTFLPMYVQIQNISKEIKKREGI
jgi:hypothetical protein